MQFTCVGYLFLEQHDLPHADIPRSAAPQCICNGTAPDPDKYAQERGGWSSDRVMKTYTLIHFGGRKRKVDETIDNYFDSLLDGNASEREVSHWDYKCTSGSGSERLVQSPAKYATRKCQHRN